MTDNFPYDKYCNELKISLAGSTAQERRAMASFIIEKNLDLKRISELLKGEKKIALRFLWLLTELGTLNSTKLFLELPYLFNLCLSLDKSYQMSFSSFWLVAGIPQENEAKAIDLLFSWLNSNETNVTTKSRSINLLFLLKEKYPELKHELKASVENQMDKHSKDFKNRATKIVMKLEQ